MLAFYTEIKVQSWCKIVTQHLLTACDINERGATPSAAATMVAATAAAAATTEKRFCLEWNGIVDEK